MYSKEIKDMVKRIFKKVNNEKQKGSRRCNFNYPEKRVADYTGISLRTVKRILKEVPREKPPRQVRTFKSLDDFDIDVIMRTIYKLFERKEAVFTKKLREVLLQEHGISIKKTTLLKVMKKNGLTFKKADGNRAILMERADLQVHRCHYLRAIREARELYNIVYLDETWVNANHTGNKEWFDEEKCKGRAIPVGKGQRLIQLNAIDESGFLPGCNLLFKSHSTDNRDYHTEMNAEIFEAWVEHSLLPALNQPTCVVMDNASYHSRVCPETKAPTTASRKLEMKNWLIKNNIPFQDTMLKPELYQLIKNSKPQKEYVVDRMINNDAHLVLRLPPYHCCLNPIEMIWGIMKSYIAAENKTFKLADMKVLADEAIKSISAETVSRTIGHVLKIEEHYWTADGLDMAPKVKPVIIKLKRSEMQGANMSDSDSSDSNLEDSDSSDSDTSAFDSSEEYL